MAGVGASGAKRKREVTPEADCCCDICHEVRTASRFPACERVPECAQLGCGFRQAQEGSRTPARVPRLSDLQRSAGGRRKEGSGGGLSQVGRLGARGAVGATRRVWAGAAGPGDVGMLRQQL